VAELAADIPNIQELLQEREPPCLSLYQPTHRRFPQSQQDPIRYRNLVRELQESLARGSGKHVDVLLEPLRRILDDQEFWSHPRDGLAVFSSRDLFRVYRLQRPTPELAVVADSFHVKPLLRILQSVDRYQVLALDRSTVRLYEGGRDTLDEIEPAPGVPRTIKDALGDQLSEGYLNLSTYRGGSGAGGAVFHGHGSRKDEVALDEERFFRAVDRAVQEHHSNVSRLPLVLAALPEQQAVFRRVSHNPLLVDSGVDAHPQSLSIEELRERAWGVVEPRNHARVRAVIEEFGAARAKGAGADELPEIAAALAQGRVATLLIDADQHIGGRIDENGRLHTGELSSPEHEDLLDDLGELAIRQGGELLVLPGQLMPTQSGAAAIYRY